MPRFRDRVKAFLEGKSVVEWNGNKPGKWIWKDTGTREVSGEYLLSQPEVQRTIQKIKEMKENGSL